MFIRAYNSEKGIRFFGTVYDGPQIDMATNQPGMTAWNVTSAIYPDLEFLNWKTGKSRYDEYGRML